MEYFRVQKLIQAYYRNLFHNKGGISSTWGKDILFNKLVEITNHPFGNKVRPPASYCSKNKIPKSQR